MNVDALLFLLCLGILMLACLISDGTYIRRIMQDAPPPTLERDRTSHPLGRLLVLTGALRRLH